MSTIVSMPSMFLAAGPAELGSETSRYAEFVRSLNVRLPKPTALVIATAEWESPVQHIATGAGSGDLVLGLDIQSRFAAECIRAELVDWQEPTSCVSALLRLLAPSSHVPVALLSVNPKLVPEEHYRIGQAMQGLRERGVLLIGSGPIPTGPAAVRWSEWMHEHMLLWNLEALFDYQRRAPALAPSASPRPPAALAPLLLSMGAAEQEQQCRRLYKEANYRGSYLTAWRFG
ncbi:dioxygenase [Paenibacillus sp. HJGM_3]|uniref:dioxygenase family protein n=1 Tax=Paenibacillus sp. HJGM_3 TaxID=3379816 RepID=UPI00385F9926